MDSVVISLSLPRGQRMDAASCKKVYPSRHVHHGILQLADSFDGPTASHSHLFLWLYLSEFGTCIIPSQRPTSFPAQSIQNLLNQKKTTKTMFQWLGEPP
ncbi:unnamed protein product [Musa acuminata var. zebrina]